MMLNEQNLRGIFVPVVTPFQENEQLDLNSYRNYVSKLFKHDIKGLVINGTTGESPTVSWEEVTELVKATKEVMIENGTRLPIIIGTGTNNTAFSVQQTEKAGQLGADAVLIIVPYYNRPSQEGILEHFRKVAQVGMPIIAYEVPSRTGVGLTTDTAMRILDLSGVIGLKDSSGDIGFTSKLTSQNIKPILCGDDHYFHSMLNQGACGGILAAANVQTASFVNVFNLFSRGDVIASKQAFDLLVPLIEHLFQESNPSPLKWLLARQGTISSDTLRLPMNRITDELQLQLEQLLPSLV